MSAETRAEQRRRKYKKIGSKARNRDVRADPEDIADFLALTHDPDWRVRREAVQCLCPCHVQSDHPEVWDRLLQMVDDPEVKVRATVLHTLGDGSPRAREHDVIEALERMYHDPDLRLRRHVRKLLAHYRHRGTVNIL